jgi:hypothetical protein
VVLVGISCSGILVVVGICGCSGMFSCSWILVVVGICGCSGMFSCSGILVVVDCGVVVES